MPSTPQTEPLGFHRISPDGTPSGETYWVGDLAVFGQAADRLLVREEAALSMGDRDSVDRPGLTAGPAMGI